jgi:hypothetical protein
MSDSFKLTGNYASQPLMGVMSAFPSICAPIDEAIQLSKRYVDTVQLDTDGVTSVNLGGMDEANLIVLKCVGGPIELTLVSGLGTAVIPVNSFFVVFSIEEGEGFTAISLERSPGVETFVEIFIGKSA